MNKTRFKLFVVIFTFAVILLLLASMIPVEKSNADQTQTDVNNKVDSMKSSGSLMQYIFGNNLMISLIMLLPFAGQGFGILAIYNTGKVIGAEAVSQSINPVVMNMALFSTPVFWLEFFAYALAITESMIFTYYCLTHRFRNELPKCAMVLSICVVTLFVGAVVETLIINGNVFESYTLFGLFITGAIAFKSTLKYREVKRRKLSLNL